MTEYEVALLKAYIHFKTNHLDYTGYYNQEECLHYAKKWLDKNEQLYSKTVIMQTHHDNKTYIYTYKSNKTNKSSACLMNCFNFYNKKSILNIWI